ncbi:Putative 3-oxoacid CoA-transferase, beta subunit [Sodalis praecaptivus]|uniref:Putative 3-oxoacid CoA-transferase, beta subunit n=1 Tax=Sodalis praecaptivus TaxID=1239307 RepID=W0HYP6_9GAMM|nr:CoA-transferase [Sodalis praecaptivus]AHF77278.1 Putative 3-oxoacid CoA-transferase, beta subunit [Sodalis praecaptivus]
MSQPHYTTEELMICAIARELRDDELGFVGLGTAARAFTLAVGIPIAAARLAQLRQAPGFSIYWGNLLTPSLDSIPNALLQDAYTHWPAAASPADVGYKIDMVTRGRFDVSFESAPQVDQYGNLNITEIGGAQPPKTRLVGCLAQTEHLAFIKRPMIVTDLTPRAFVPKVDFITSVGYLDGGDSRAKLGLPGPGPALCITDKAIFDFEPQSKRMRLRSLHPGETVDSVLQAMSFVPVIADQTPPTAAPTQEEVRLIREVIDPHGTLYQLKASA